MRESPFLTLPEVAAYARAPLPSVRSWVASGALPSTRPGRRRMVNLADLEEFLLRGQKGESTTVRLSPPSRVEKVTAPKSPEARAASAADAFAMMKSRSQKIVYEDWRPFESS
jgi:excisionase family DNA binding protein